jgi:hypothetical protein
METNMPNTPKVLIINAVTGEEELRDMNAEELSQLEADNAQAAERAAEAEAKAAQKAALLDRLGITEDEAKLLLA